MRANLDKQLNSLNQEMIRMGMLCEKAIQVSSDSVVNHKLDEAGKLPDLLDLINDKDREVENLALTILLQQQPVATDLRRVSAALKMVTDMDRIGVQSADIAEIVTMNGIKSKISPEIPVKEMSEAVIHMVTTSIDAFVRNDENMARSVVKYDDIVDNYFDQVKGKLAEILKAPEGSSDLDAVAILDILMISKYLERIGDHAVNIARWVIFSITGVDERNR